MLESQFQAKLIKEIKKEFPGSMVLKNDPTYIQGIPDLIVLYKDKWSALEVKKSAKASHQDYYVSKMNEMSHSVFVYPENKDEVMSDLRRKFNG